MRRRNRQFSCIVIPLILMPLAPKGTHIDAYEDKYGYTRKQEHRQGPKLSIQDGMELQTLVADLNRT